jgi:hypothetical protein
VVGVALAGLLSMLNHEAAGTEFGPPGLLVGLFVEGVPLGLVVGGFVGAIHDALRLKDLERWIVVVCLLPIVLVFVVFPMIFGIFFSNLWSLLG